MSVVFESVMVFVLSGCPFFLHPREASEKARVLPPPVQKCTGAARMGRPPFSSRRVRRWLGERRGADALRGQGYGRSPSGSARTDPRGSASAQEGKRMDADTGG